MKRGRRVSGHIQLLGGNWIAISICHSGWRRNGTAERGPPAPRSIRVVLKSSSSSSNSGHWRGLGVFADVYSSFSINSSSLVSSDKQEEQEEEDMNVCVTVFWVFFYFMHGFIKFGWLTNYCSNSEIPFVFFSLLKNKQYVHTFKYLIMFWKKSRDFDFPAGR